MNNFSLHDAERQEAQESRTVPARGRVRIFLVCLGMLGAFGAIAAMLLTVQFRYADRTHTTITGTPHRPVAIVLGASVKRDGTPSAALEDRIVSGVELYKAGVVDTLLMTGDDGKFHINEIGTMTRVAREQGVADNDIRSDGQGYRTYESCKRAHDVYGITEAVVVTQRFHLGRALYLCNQLGIDAIGYTADRRAYDMTFSFWTRDLFASIKAFVDVHIFAPRSPVPVLSGKGDDR